MWTEAMLKRKLKEGKIQHYKILTKESKVPKPKEEAKAVKEIRAMLLPFQDVLKYKVEEEFKFHPERKWRFDFAIPELKAAIEYEGLNSKKSRHTTLKGYSGDSTKYNEAQRLGWVVLRYTAITY